MYKRQGADIVALDENAAQKLHPAVEQRNFSQLFLGEDAVGLIEAGQLSLIHISLWQNGAVSWNTEILNMF